MKSKNIYVIKTFIILRNPKHKEYEDMLEWAGGEFDPEFFDPEEVMFDDPAKRRKMAME
jgi:hypothetical protein